MGRREVFEIPGVSHAPAPIPLAVRVGPILFTSAIMGVDPATGKAPADPDRQVDFAFAHLDDVLRQAGLNRDSIGHVSALLTDDDMRPRLNRVWIEWFPNADDRPARHVALEAISDGMRIKLEVVAVAT